MKWFALFLAFDCKIECNGWFDWLPSAGLTWQLYMRMSCTLGIHGNMMYAVYCIWTCKFICWVKALQCSDTLHHIYTQNQRCDVLSIVKKWASDFDSVDCFHKVTFAMCIVRFLAECAPFFSILQKINPTRYLCHVYCRNVLCFCSILQQINPTRWPLLRVLSECALLL